MTENMSHDTINKLGDTASKLILTKAVLDLVYSIHTNSPVETIGPLTEKLCEAMDQYIDHRVTAMLERVLKDVLDASGH